VDSTDPDQELYLQFLKFKRQREVAQEMAVRQASSHMAHTSPAHRLKVGMALSQQHKAGSAAKLQ
jgi:hypothetical protein